MKNKKFSGQACNKISILPEKSIKITDGSIEISDDDKVIFETDSKGGMFCSADKQFTNTVNKLHNKTENVIFNTKGFFEVMDSSPELTAFDLNVPYKKLLEYSNVVLALKLYDDDFRKIDPTDRISTLFDAIPSQLNSNVFRCRVEKTV